jgi:hypothetical protein
VTAFEKDAPPAGPDIGETDVDLDSHRRVRGPISTDLPAHHDAVWWLPLQDSTPDVFAVDVALEPSTTP